MWESDGLSAPATAGRILSCASAGPDADAERARLVDTEALDVALRDARRHAEATLQEVSLFSVYSHPSGFFARAEANWFQQKSAEFVSSTVASQSEENTALPKVRVTHEGLPPDAFWHFNLFAGYRFFRNQCAVTVGVLSLGDSDYRLNPLNPDFDLSRERTWFVRC